MLRFERRQIAANVTEGVMPYVQAFEARYGALPTGYWEDDYVLGFVPALAGLFAKAITRGQISDSDQKEVVQDCLESVSRGFGAPIMTRVHALMLTAPADFVAGAHAAGKVLAFSMGQCPPDDADLQQAQQTAAQQQGGAAFPTPAAEFAGTARALVNLLFYDVVDKRLMGDTSIPETNSAADTQPADPSLPVSVRF
jgi:hypothetical protein